MVSASHTVFSLAREWAGQRLVQTTIVDPTGDNLSPNAQRNPEPQITFKSNQFLIAHVIQQSIASLVFLVIGNIGRYLNHSCEPNLSLVTVRSSCMVPHLALFTNRDVAEVTGVEISVTITM